MKRYLAIILAVCISFSANSQNYKNQRLKYAVFNIGLNALVGGTGALVNKRQNEKALNVFFKGFRHGALGGTFTYLGKDLTYQIANKQNLNYAWFAKMSNSIGASITQNASNNLPFWEQWHFNLGFFRFDYNAKQKAFQARIQTSTLVGFAMLSSQGKFNLKNSIAMGTFIFENDGPVSALRVPASGYGITTSIAYSNRVIDFYDLMAHEMMHIIQYESFVHVNPYFTKLDKNLKSKSSLYNNLSKYIYFDWNGPTLYGLYQLQINNEWICRHLEREAENFAERRLLPYCN